MRRLLETWRATRASTEAPTATEATRTVARRVGFTGEGAIETSATLAAGLEQPRSHRALMWSLTIITIAAAGQRGDWAAVARGHEVQSAILRGEGRSTVDVDELAKDAWLLARVGRCNGSGSTEDRTVPAVHHSRRARRAWLPSLGCR